MNIQFSLLLLYLLFICFINAEPLVTISHGILNGTVQISRYGRNYSAFLGIPYAKPPIGNLRFANPEPADNWAEIRSASSFGNVCPQLEGERVIGNEDCLFLNVYSPFLDFSSSLPNNTLIPVMVWIHGGGFSAGSSNMFGAGYFLDKNVILVTINYRLGIFGFFSTGNSAASGNFGLKDQVLALKWIQKNIIYFGGDPNKVILFGQSAGGASVSLHTVSKASNGLFHQYIIQSGAVLCPWLYQKRSNFPRYARGVSVAVFCSFISSRRLVDCLRRRSVQRLIRTTSTLGRIARFGQIVWTPTDEPDDAGAFLIDSPKNLVRNNQLKDLPFISGVVTKEGLVFTSELYTNDVLYNSARLGIAPLIAYHSQYFSDSINVVQFTAAVNRFYFNNSLITASKESFLESLTSFISDGFFHYPQLKLLEKFTPRMKNSNYFYSFDYLGAAHGGELVYLFPKEDGFQTMSNPNFTLIERSISDTMIDMWTSFAINGKPTSDKLNNPNLWTPYTSENGVHLQIGTVQNDSHLIVMLSNIFYPERMHFWEKYAPL